MKFSLRDIKYAIKDFFFPHNVIKIQNLDRSWHDRDYVLFHAMFQIFVDYIELEHPFAPWDKRRNIKGRYTDHAEMVKHVEDSYGPNRIRLNEDDNEVSYAERVYPIYTELLWIYKWYKDREWDDSDMESDWDREMKLREKCDDMLHRIVAWRHHFWT